MFHHTKQGVLRPVIGSVAALALLVPAAGVTEAAPTQRGSAPVATAAAGGTAARVAAKTVLSNDYGKATSTVSGTFGKHGSVSGSFKPRHFVINKSGELIAVGALTAKLTRGDGTVVGKATKDIRIPVKKIEGVAVGGGTASAVAAAKTCDILNLVLGPLDLNVLGLEVHLSRVVLDIVAVTGAGNLLGNLLCAVAGLLDQTGLLTQVAQILDSVAAILRI
jgi:hypothetical protein